MLLLNFIGKEDYAKPNNDDDYKNDKTKPLIVPA